MPYPTAIRRGLLAAPLVLLGCGDNPLQPVTAPPEPVMDPFRAVVLSELADLGRTVSTVEERAAEADVLETVLHLMDEATFDGGAS